MISGETLLKIRLEAVATLSRLRGLKASAALLRTVGEIPALCLEISRLQDAALVDADREGADGARITGLEEDISLIRADRDRLQKMLDDANAREELQLEVAQAAITRRNEIWERLQKAAREAKETRAVLYPTQRIEVALAAVDRYNALLGALASEEGIVDEADPVPMCKVDPDEKFPDGTMTMGQLIDTLTSPKPAPKVEGSPS